MKTNIGWIGLGKMGVPMATRLLIAGYPLAVHNRTEGKCGSLLSRGAIEAPSPAGVIDRSEVVFIMVSDDQATKNVFTEKDGILAANSIGGKIIINMSTVSPGISVEMERQCSAKGCHYLDVPVSGSVKPAENGELVVMAGGDEDIFEQVRPILNHLCKLAVYAGLTGAGNKMKLAVNLLLGIITQGLSEAAVFAENSGLKTKDLFEVIQNGVLGSPYIRMKGEAIMQENYKAAFALKHIVKDLQLAVDAGLSTSLGQAALNSFKKAGGEFGEEDLIAIYKALRS